MWNTLWGTERDCLPDLLRAAHSRLLRDLRTEHTFTRGKEDLFLTSEREIYSSEWGKDLYNTRCCYP